MKESRYIELLNLYVDHQLTPAEAAELEAEVHADPKRRRIYTQYCQMQKACTLIFDAERSIAPKTAAVVAAFESERPGRSYPRVGLFGTLGALGLAAAVALVAFVGVPRHIFPSSPTLQPAPAIAILSRPAGLPSDPGSAAPSATAPVARMAVGLVADGSSSAAPEETVVMMASAPVPNSSRSPFHTFLLGTTSMLSRVAESEPSGSPQVDLAWLNDVKLPVVRPLLENRTMFESNPTLRQEGTRPYRSHQPGKNGSTEMISFQFQR